MTDYSIFPKINATLNGCSAVLLVTGRAFIARGKVTAHRAAMVAAFVTSGVLNQELFFQTNGEMLFVWERLREVVPSFRESTKNPNSWHNLEIVGNAFIKRMEANGPDAYPHFQKMVHGTGRPKEG